MDYVAVNHLRLVCAPLSNQEADWLSADPEFRAFVAHSKLYMVGQHEEVLIDDWVVDEATRTLQFSLSNTQHRIEKITLPLKQFGDDGFHLEIGRKSIRILSPGDKRDVVAWFTVEKLLFDVSRGHIEIQGLGDWSAFRKYTLHYVGISKESDSMSRLFATAHEKRSKILSNETQIRTGARLTDELFIFLFDLEDLQVKTFSPEEPNFVEVASASMASAASLDKKRLAADAEKAFTKILQTKYNAQRYENFPRGSDGLYDQGLDRYVYSIHEDLEFRTETAVIRGSASIWEGKAADFIAIEGDEVTLYTV